MTGETISELLKPLVGKSGTIFMVVHQTGQVGFTTAENKKLTGVEIRPDSDVAWNNRGAAYHRLKDFANIRGDGVFEVDCL
jgi:hypothetical protein